MDNFYTHHILELVLFNISDGYVHGICTVRVNNIKGLNNKSIKITYIISKIVQPRLGPTS